MIDFDELERLHKAFTRLLDELQTNWPASNVEFVREEIGHGVYGDALENLIAMGLKNGIGFEPDRLRQIEAMASTMKMTDSPFLVKLRQNC